MHAPEAVVVSERCSDVGDYIGMESCVDLAIESTADANYRASCGGGGGEKRDDRRWKREKKDQKEKEYPPPIPWLSRSGGGNLKRYYTEDGRLIIREEKVKNPEYFRTHRSDGRLTLQLIHLNNDDEEEEEEDEAPSPKSTVVMGGGGGGGAGGKYYNYKTVTVRSSGSCLFVNPNPVPSIRPVHI